MTIYFPIGGSSKKLKKLLHISPIPNNPLVRENIYENQIFPTANLSYLNDRTTRGKQSEFERQTEDSQDTNKEFEEIIPSIPNIKSLFQFILRKLTGTGRIATQEIYDKYRILFNILQKVYSDLDNIKDNSAQLTEANRNKIVELRNLLNTFNTEMENPIGNFRTRWDKLVTAIDQEDVDSLKTIISELTQLINYIITIYEQKAPTTLQGSGNISIPVKWDKEFPPNYPVLLPSHKITHIGEQLLAKPLPQRIIDPFGNGLKQVEFPVRSRIQPIYS